MICPHCKSDLDGGSIYETFLEKYGDHEKALSAAACYGATQTTGRWGREIGMYSQALDRTLSYQCPDCHGEWLR